MAEESQPQLYHGVEEEKKSYDHEKESITKDVDLLKEKECDEKENDHNYDTPPAEETTTETKDRGLFDFMGKKDQPEEIKKLPQEEEEEIAATVAATEVEKVHVFEPEKEVEEVEEKKLERSHSTSSSSSSDEEEGENKKKKKGLKEKIKEKISGEDNKGGGENIVEIKTQQDEGAYGKPEAATHLAEENKGFLDKIKDKLPVPVGVGQAKTTDDIPPTSPPTAEETPHAQEAEQIKEKKGIFEKIKEKIPGYHPKTEEGKKQKVEEEGAAH